MVRPGPRKGEAHLSSSSFSLPARLLSGPRLGLRANVKGGHSAPRGLPGNANLEQLKNGAKSFQCAVRATPRYSRSPHAQPIGEPSRDQQELVNEFLRLATARVLLDHGADPNAGFLWEGLSPPFTALRRVRMGRGRSADSQ
jgi:hypothetical protein